MIRSLALLILLGLLAGCASAPKQVMLNYSTMSKFGLRLGEVVLSFRRRA